MKKASIAIQLTFLLLGGCSNTGPEITESEAEAIVEQRHTNSFVTVEIISISYERGRYVVEWENEGNCEWGVDYVDGHRVVKLRWARGRFADNHKLRL